MHYCNNVFVHNRPPSFCPLPSRETRVAILSVLLSEAADADELLTSEDSFLFESLPMGRNPLATLFIPAMPHHKRYGRPLPSRVRIVWFLWCAKMQSAKKWF